METVRSAFGSSCLVWFKLFHINGYKTCEVLLAQVNCAILLKIAPAISGCGARWFSERVPCVKEFQGVSSYL